MPNPSNPYASPEAEVYSEVESFTRIREEDAEGPELEPGMQKWLLERIETSERKAFAVRYNEIMKKERQGLRQLKISEVLFGLLTIIFLIMYLPVIAGILF
jgi:predicted nucleic acid-binding Zn ribbon protein